MGWTSRRYYFYRYQYNTVIFPTEVEYNDNATILSKHNEGYYLLPIKLDKVKLEVEKLCKDTDLFMTLNQECGVLFDLKMLESFTLYSLSYGEPFLSFSELKDLLKEWFKGELQNISEVLGSRVVTDFYNKVYQLEAESRERYREQQALKKKVG